MRFGGDFREGERGGRSALRLRLALDDS